MRYYTARYYESKCHILEVNPMENRVDVTIGRHGILERLSSMNGEPNENEVTVAKMNGGFFCMNGSSEFIGSYVDNGIFYQGANATYPTAYFDKNYNMNVDYNPSLERHAWYQFNTFWAIGVPWTLIVNGAINFSYSIKDLVKWYGHPTVRAPRTLIGQKEDKTVVMVVVDGRTAYSRGVNIYQSADIMFRLGCKWAFNLDGGGSSEMIVNDNIVNHPSDGRERRIGTAFVVYKNKDSAGSSNIYQQGTVTASVLNVRDKPLNGRILGTVRATHVVKIIDIDHATGWYKIDYNGYPAYVSNNYVKLN